MKNAKTLVAAILMSIALPAMAMAQNSWWQGFSSAPQGNQFQQWLATHPNAGRPLQQNPYQIYDPSWRANHPELQDYIHSNPTWWNGMRAQGPQYYDQKFGNFLNTHPNVARELRANPELVYDKHFIHQHPELSEYLGTHKNVWREARYEAAAAAPPRGFGAYDNHNQWRDADWWHQNDRRWFYRNHPEWAENHPQWRDEDGDFDDSHHWHDRYWWSDHHPDWVEHHHPNWDKHEAHREWKEQKNAAKAEAQYEGKHGNGHGHHGDND
jgi:hypothetical protein